MDSTFLTCPICFEEFNLTRFLPRMLPSCGHTVCSECLNKLLQSSNGNQRRCPIDKLPFPTELTNVNGFKANFLAKEILDTRSQKELCEEHNEEMIIFCFTDQKKICATCVCEGAHQSHKIKTMKAMKSEANSQAKKIKDALNNLDICHSKASQTLAETKTLLIERVKNEFQGIKRAITDKEQDIIYQIQSYFYHQEQKLSHMIGDASNTGKNLHSQASNLEKFLKNEDLLKYEELFQKIPDQLVNCKNDVDFELIKEESEVIRTKFEDLLQSFNKSLQDSQIHVWSDLKLDLKTNLFNNLALGILKDLPAQSTNSPDEMETEEDPFIFKASTSFQFKYDREELTVLTTGLSNENTIDIDKWKNAKSVIFGLSYDITEEDSKVLAVILRKLKTHDLLYLQFYSNGFSPKVLELFAQTSLSFSKAEIWLDKLDLTSEHNSTVFGRMLSQWKNLEDISIFFEEAKLNKNTLQGLLGGLLLNGKDIKSIDLNLSLTDVLDDDICQFSLNLPQIKHFGLCLNNTKVTSRTIEWLGKNLFKPMSCLKSLKLGFNKTQITDAHMDNLFSEVKKIKNLSLDLGSANITNKTLEVLSQTIKRSEDCLEELEIGLFDNNVKDEGASLLFMPLPNLTKLTLILANTKITDKTIELVAQKTLSSALKLKHFSLVLGNLTVTDSSMHQIFEALPQLDELGIRLNSTLVTDISVAPFIIDRVPAMKGLSKFKMVTSDSNVSSEVQAKIQELENAINSVQ